MEFSLTFEQSALKDGVARFVAETHGFGEARRLMSAPRAGPTLSPPPEGVEKLGSGPSCLESASGGYSPAHWRRFGELGWLALLVSDANGGLGGTLIDASLVMEEFGKGLVAAPYVSTAVAAALLLDGEPRHGSLLRELVERVVGGRCIVALAVDEPGAPAAGAADALSAVRDAHGFRLSGRTTMCIDGGVADGFIVAAPLRIDGAAPRPALFYVPRDAAGLVRRSYRTIDARSAADLTFDGVRLSEDALVAAPGVASARLERALDAARLMLAAEAIGIMEAAIATTADYLRTRKQFGRALSSFQVLTHRVSEMLVRKEHARSILFHGLSRIDADDAQRAAAVSAAMVVIIETGEFVGSQAIQLHGGIGMTDEYVVGHHYKRLRAIGKTWGDLSWHMERFMHWSERADEGVTA